MNPSVWTALQPILAQGARDVLRIVGTYLAAHGIIVNGSAGVETFIGAGMALAGLLWGWWTTSGYMQVGALLQKLTAQPKAADAVKAAQVLPPAAAVDSAAKSASVQTVVKVLLAAFVLSLFLAGHSAQAQKLTGNIARDIAAASQPAATASSAPSGSVDAAVSNFNAGIQKITKDLVDKAIADVTAAQTDAQNHNDQIAKPCWDANLALLKSLPSQWENPPPSPIGIALGIQIQRDLLNAITGNDAASLKVACAALWGDQLKIVGQLGALLGIRIASGGLL